MTNKILWASAGLLAALALLAPSAAAQYRAPGNPDGFQNNEQDPNKNNFSGFDPMSLIHNANLSRSRNGYDFAEDTQRQLNQAAEEFKKQQQLQLQHQQAPTLPLEGTAAP